MRKLYSFLRGVYGYYRDYATLRRSVDTRIFPFGRPYPVLDEGRSEAGTMRGHYFHQDLVVARRIYENKPIRHIDIGSRIDGFVAHCAVFREIEVFDIREMKSSAANIRFTKADLMNPSPEMRAICDSVSSLHAIEHFGLGRYGDPISSEGHLLAIRNIHHILAAGGIFYFSVPIGPQRIEFNAHRVFNITYLLEILNPMFTLERFSYVDDRGDLFSTVSIDDKGAATNFGCIFGVGIFELRKK